MIPGACCHPERLGQFRDGDPVHLIRIHDAVKQVALRADGDGIRMHVLAADIDRRAHRKAQTLSLADGIPDCAVMPSDLFSRFIEEIALRVMLSGKVLHETGVVAVRHEADVLTVVLPGVDELLLFRNFTHFGLVESAQWKPDMSQLFLRQIVQHITLVFSLIQTLFQQPAASGFVLLDPGIVTGHNVVNTMFSRPIQQVVELHIFVAVDAGIRGSAGLIDPNEFVDDFLPEIHCEIQHFVRNIHRERHFCGILDILFGTAGVKARLSDRLVPGQAHGDAGAVVSGVLHQPRRHRAVHATTHGNESLGVLCICHIFLCPLLLLGRSIFPLHK